jgi:hypothetical protein
VLHVPTRSLCPKPTRWAPSRSLSQCRTDVALCDPHPRPLEGHATRGAPQQASGPLLAQAAPPIAVRSSRQQAPARGSTAGRTQAALQAASQAFSAARGHRVIVHECACRHLPSVAFSIVARSATSFGMSWLCTVLFSHLPDVQPAPQCRLRTNRWLGCSLPPQHVPLCLTPMHACHCYASCARTGLCG